MSPVDDDRNGRTFHPPGLASGVFATVTREAGRMPLVALSLGLQAWQRTSGLRALVVRRSNEVLQIAAHTPIGRFLPQPVLDDGADEEAVRIASDARDVRRPASAAAPPPAPAPAPAPARAPARATVPVSDAVDAIAEQLEIAEPQSRDDLPIPDFDNVSLGSLRARLRSLSVEQLVTLREWEQAHGHRLPVMTLLDNRIAKVAHDATTAAYPTETDVSGDGRVRR